MSSGHYCRGGQWKEGDRGYEILDAQGISCGRVCDRCVDERRARYRPEIFSGYTQADVDEPIEAEDRMPGELEWTEEGESSW